MSRRRRPLPDPPTSFPAAWAVTYAEAHKNVPAEPPGPCGPAGWHRTLALPTLVSTCVPCAVSRINWMASYPEGHHLGRLGRMLAHVHSDLPGIMRPAKR